MTVTPPRITITDPPTPRPGVRAILTPSWLLVIGLAAAFAAACWFVLAPWQFSRNTERDAQNAQIEAALAAPTVAVTQLLSPGAEPDASSEWRSITATGTFLVDRQVFVRLRQADGQDAREVVAPFRLADGTLLLVDRGYTLTLDLNAGRLPDPLPRGEVTITGRVSADQPDPSNRPSQQVAGRTEVYGIDSAALLGAVISAGTDSTSTASGSTGSLRGFVQLSANSAGVLMPIGVPDRDSGPFLSYALQWCVFGAVALLAAGFFAYREVTVPYPEPYSDDAVQPAVPAPSKRFTKSDLYD